jgi:hypothetical protein
MIWTHLMCSNGIIFSLHTKLLLAEHIPLPCYTLLPFPSKILYGLKETFVRSAAIPLTDSHLCRFLDSLNLHMQLNTMLLADAFSPHCADNQQ